MRVKTAADVALIVRAQTLGAQTVWSLATLKMRSLVWNPKVQIAMGVIKDRVNQKDLVIGDMRRNTQLHGSLKTLYTFSTGLIKPCTPAFSRCRSSNGTSCTRSHQADLVEQSQTAPNNAVCMLI